MSTILSYANKTEEVTLMRALSLVQYNDISCVAKGGCATVSHYPSQVVLTLILINV